MSTDQPTDWNLNLAIYPSFHEIVDSLQDAGVVASSSTKLAKKTGIQKRKHVKIAKIATVVHKKIKDLCNPHAQLDDNVSRGKNVLCMEMLQSRKHVDTCDTNIAFHSCGKDGKVCLIHNNPRFAGLDLAVKKFQQAHEHNTKSRAAHRTPEDGLRLAGVLFHPEHRAAVAGVMTNKKDRKKSDVPGDTTRNFFAHALNDFSDPSFEVSTPREEHW